MVIVDKQRMREFRLYITWFKLKDIHDLSANQYDKCLKCFPGLKKAIGYQIFRLTSILLWAFFFCWCGYYGLSNIPILKNMFHKIIFLGSFGVVFIVIYLIAFVSHALLKSLINKDLYFIDEQFEDF